MCSDERVLDPQQLVRIQAVHRGFLYQHLYGVACIFQLSSTGPVALTVERDEDLEQSFSGARRYIQVKTRREPLVHSDIAGALARFDEIRAEHVNGRRSGAPEFVVVANVEIAPSLTERIGSSEWPLDVRVITPGTEHVPIGLPRPAPNLESALLRCVKLAEAVPHRVVAETTLAWKLAALVQAAAAGGMKVSPDVFRFPDLPNLLEQVQIPLQQLPVPPWPYRVQAEEPRFPDGDTPLLIFGFSGSGKTSWAAEQAVHSSAAVVYFDIGDIPSAALTSTVARELAARLFATHPNALASVLRPGVSGLDSIRALNAGVAMFRDRPVFVLDNVHRVSVSTLVDMIAAAPRLRWVLIGQPSVEASYLESVLQTKVVQLSGWSLDEIAAEFRSAGVPISAEQCDRVRRITAGQPMYVRNAAQLVSQYSSGDVSQWCSDVEKGTHDNTTAQEFVLARVGEALSPDARLAATVLAVADVPMTREHVRTLLESVGLQEPCASTAVRELRKWTVVSQSAGGQLTLHDAFRVVATQEWGLWPRGKQQALKTALLSVLQSPPPGKRESRWFSLLLRTLVETGHVREFVDIASNQGEALYEFGFGPITEALARELHEKSGLSIEDRFWLTDVLAFLAVQNGRDGEFRVRVQEMQELVSQFRAGATAWGAFFTKKLAAASNVPECRKAYSQALAVIKENRTYDRIVQYQYALGLFRLSAYKEALPELLEAAERYFAHFSIRPEDFYLAKNAAVMELLSKVEDWEDDAKRFADVLALIGTIRDKLGLPPRLEAIWAMKLYAVTAAHRSLISVGQDVADRFLAIGDPEGAREMIEQHLLPPVRELNLVEYSFRVRSQYAVVLARCERIAEAREELKRLSVYKGSIREDEETFERQVRLVEKIAKDHASSREQALPHPGSARALRVGRNDPCWCGSGRKYKRCHGA